MFVGNNPAHLPVSSTTLLYAASASVSSSFAQRASKIALSSSRSIRCPKYASTHLVCPYTAFTCQVTTVFVLFATAIVNNLSFPTMPQSDLHYISNSRLMYNFASKFVAPKVSAAITWTSVSRQLRQFGSLAYGNDSAPNMIRDGKRQIVFPPVGDTKGNEMLDARPAAPCSCSSVQSHCTRSGFTNARWSKSLLEVPAPASLV